jgi:hypothetical protein
MGAPPAGLEPATYGLEVRHDPCAWCRRGASSQVASDLPSAWSHPGRHRDNDRIANGIASLTTGPANTSPPRPATRRRHSSPYPEQTAHAEDHQLHHKTRLDSPAAPDGNAERGGLRCRACLGCRRRSWCRSTAGSHGKGACSYAIWSGVRAAWVRTVARGLSSPSPSRDRSGSASCCAVGYQRWTPPHRTPLPRWESS